MYLSWPLWLLNKDRTYPLIPLVDLSAVLDVYFVNMMLLFAIGLAAIGLFLMKNKRLWLLLLLGLYSFLIIIDINRLQAWLFQYALIWGAGVWAYSNPAQGQSGINQTIYREKSALFLMQMVFIATYLWAGLNKLNVHYLGSVFNWLMGIFEWSSFLKNNQFAAVASVLVEIAVGVGLVFARTRRWSVILGVIMHVVILILLIADGWNKIVYPWNVGMCAGLYLLFWNIDRQLLWGSLKQTVITQVYAFLLFFAPILQLFGFWQYNLSNTMYSGLSLEVEFVGLDKGMGCFPAKFNNGKIYGVETDSSFIFDLDDWVMNEFEAPYYAEEWIIPVLQKKYCPCLGQYNGFIRIERASRWHKQKEQKIIPCR